MLKSFARFSLTAWIGLNPIKAFAGSMLLLGVGVPVVSGMLNTPTILPQPSAAFTQSNAFGNVNVGLKPNGGVPGAFQLPSTCSAVPSAPATCSFAIYHELTIDPNVGGGTKIALGNGVTNNGGLLITANNPGSPQFSFEHMATGTGSQNFPWWLPTISLQVLLPAAPSITPGSNYNPGFYTWTASDGCLGNGAGAREPTGTFLQKSASGNQINYQVDPGFLCGENASGLPPQINFAAIAGVGSHQGTGPSSTPAAAATTCASNTPTSSQYTVTVNVGVAHGVYPGQSFTLAGFTPSGFNGTYAAIAGTADKTLVGTIANTTGTCPTGAIAEGTVGNGTGGALTSPTPSHTNPWGSQQGTGIQARSGQRVCGAIGEFGADSNFPGAQFAYYTTQGGTALPGSPAVSPWLNQGATNFTGFTVAGAQSAGNPALTVTAMNAYTIASASYASGTGFVTFTMSQNPGFIVGSEFTVSGMSVAGFNKTYVAVAGTSGTTLVGNPLSGPVGVPQANNPGASSGTGGSLVGVIMPGMYVTGLTSYSVISPFGTFGSTGVGGVGTYGLTKDQATYSISGSIAPGGVGGTATLTVTGTPTSQIVVGAPISSPATAGTIVTSLVSGAGGAGTYGVSISQTRSGPFATSGGSIGSSGSPVPMYAAATFYYNIAPSGSAAGGGTITVHARTVPGDFFSFIGTSGLSAPGASTGSNALGWGGMIANVGMYYGAFPNVNGAPSSTGMSQICGKTLEFQNWASTYGGSWNSLYRLNDGGIWANSSVAQFTGSISGTALTIASTQTGALPAVTGGLPAITVAGAGIAGCPNTCPTIATGSGSSYVLSASGGTVASEPMTAGNFETALPLGLSSFTGAISGSTLTVSAMATTWVGTAHLTAAGGAPCTAGAACTTLTLDSTASGGLAANQCLFDNGVSISPQNPLCITGGSGSVWTVTNTANYYGAISSENMWATKSAVVPGVFISDGGVNLTTPVQVTGYGTLTPCPTTGITGCGTYKTSAPSTLSVAAETMTSTGIGSGGAIAPGAALEVDNPGTGVIYPITNFSTDVGTMKFAGTYNTGLLGGTPTFIQAQVSSTPSGPPVSGCSACAWTNLSSALISGGTWTGSAANIPAGGPYYIAFRAANGPNYATLPNAVFVGVTIAAVGEGNGAAQLSGGPGLTNQTNFNGFTFMTGFTAGGSPATQVSAGIFIPGPAILGLFSASQPAQLLVDRFGVFAGATSGGWDGTITLANNASSMLGGAPVGLASWLKNGTGTQNILYDNTPQTQTIGVGDGSTTTFSSGMAYGGSVGSATVSTNATGVATTAGGVSTLNITLGASTPGWSYITPGDQVTCASCLANTIITAQSGSGAPALTGIGASGTYAISPSQAFGSQALTITHNTLEFNSAYGNGAIIQGSIAAGNPGVLTVGTVTTGSLAPSGLTNMVLSGTGIPAGVNLLACLTNCGANNFGASSTWQLSQNFGSSVSTEPMYLAPSTGIPYPASNPQPPIIPVIAHGGGGGGGTPVVKFGTFKVLVNGATVCSDTTTFAYNEQAGNCTGTGVSGWVNYVTGAFSVSFTTAPAANASIVAQWTNLMSGNNSGAQEQIGWVGDGTKTGGVLSSITANTGGVNAISMGQQCVLPPWQVNYPTWAAAQNQTYGVVPAGLHNGMTGTPLLNAGMWRSEGPVNFYGGQGNLGTFDCEQGQQDQATRSEFNGTISGASGTSAVLTINSAAPIWEGELLECNPYAQACALPVGTEIVALCTAALCGTASPQILGAIGSTYLLNSPSASFTNIGSAIAIHNALFYTPGTASYVGPYNDLSMQSGSGGMGGASVETGGGITGALRYGNRFGLLAGAALSGHPEKATSPTLARTSFTGCDAAAVTLNSSPCFDIGNTFAATATTTAISGSILTFNGLAAGARPIVPGQAASCSGCAAGLVVLSISNPPTPSTVAGAGQIGTANNGFTVTLSASAGVTGAGHAFTFGCSGTSGSGSNCIDFNFNINTTGTYGTAAALNTCGVNNLVGTNTNTQPSTAAWIYPNGQCVPTGTGAFVRGFRIGTSQIMDDQTAATGSVYDFGADPGNSDGRITQNSAFTCNLVAATIVQCVLGPNYASGVFSSIGKWLLGSTFTSYGDMWGTSAYNGGLVGYPGGQMFPVTGGSGYANGSFFAGAFCPLATNGGNLAKAPVMGYSVAGGSLISAYPTVIGNGAVLQCTFPLNFSFTASVAAGTGHVAMTVPTSLVVGSTGVPSGGSATLNVTNTPTVPLAVGQQITTMALTFPMVITNLGTGTGGAGTYTVSVTANATAVSCTTLCNNSSVAKGSLVAGEVISGTGIAAGTTVVSGPSAGLGGSYVINCPTACSAGTGASLIAGQTTGAGGSITTPPQLWSTGNLVPDGVGGIGTYDSDSNIIGDFLQDNSGLPGNPNAGAFSIPAGGLESTGVPVRPFGMVRGPPVSG